MAIFFVLHTHLWPSLFVFNCFSPAEYPKGKVQNENDKNDTCYTFSRPPWHPPSKKGKGGGVYFPFKGQFKTFPNCEYQYLLWKMEMELFYDSFMITLSIEAAWNKNWFSIRFSLSYLLIFSRRTSD